VTKLVTSEKQIVYGLAFAPSEDRNDPSEAYKARAQMAQLGGPVKLTMTPEEAKSAKPFIRLAAVIRSESRIHEAHDHIQPELTFPHEINVTGYYLQMTVERLFVFDSRTGKILKTLPYCEQGTDQPGSAH
jgi:hypothetical protein